MEKMSQDQEPNVEKKHEDVKATFTELNIELKKDHQIMDLMANISRAITYDSKGIITELHQYQARKFRDPPEAEKELRDLWTAIMKKVEDLRTGPLLQMFMLVKSASASQLAKFQGPISHGLQEFVEAVAFLRFIQDQKLLKKAEFVSILTYTKQDSGGQFTAPEQFPVSELDFVLGLTDFIGELMRTVPGLVSTPSYDAEKKLYFFKMLIMSQSLYQGLQAISSAPPELTSKLEMMRDNVMKMESALCDLRLKEEELLADPPLLESFITNSYKKAQDPK